MQPGEKNQSQVEHSQKICRKRWITVVILICVLSLIGVLSFCILGVIGLVIGGKPKTNLVFYQDASIAHMFETCEQGRHYQFADWMAPVAGTDVVMTVYYSKSGPAPEAFYAYDFFIQIKPELVTLGQKLLLPGPGVQPFLLEFLVVHPWYAHLN